MSHHLYYESSTKKENSLVFVIPYNFEMNCIRFPQSQQSIIVILSFYIPLANYDYFFITKRRKVYVPLLYFFSLEIFVHLLFL